MCPQNSDIEWWRLHTRVIRVRWEQNRLLRAHVWFPGMDSQCNKFVSTCIACQSNTPQTHRELLRMTDLPKGPWDKISVDFCGPMASGDLALVFYCQYARYPVVQFVGFTSEKATIFKRVFDTYGVPKEIKSDNGPPFNSHKFEEYAKEEGFNHRAIPKYRDGTMIRCRDREQKQKMKQYADKRRHTLTQP